MKWALAGILFLTAIVIFSLAALDQKDVVWDHGQPKCPHCRSVVNLYAEVCPTCDTAFDWDVVEEYCTACLSRHDADFYESLVEDREEEVRRRFAEKVSPGQVEDYVKYALDIEAGECAFCGGTGKWIVDGGPVPVGDDSAPTEDVLLARLKKHLDGRCPVCFGDGSCILCGGDHLVVRGREAAARDLYVIERQLIELRPRRDPRSSIDWFRIVEGYVRKNEGREEMDRLPAADDPDAFQPDRARARLMLVREVLDGLPPRPEGS